MSHPLQFCHFASMLSVPRLRHAVTTRAGGFSSAEYSALNLAYHVGDDATVVTSNRRLLAAQLGYDPQRLVTAQQVHGARAQSVTSEMAGRGATSWEDAWPDTDALITAEEKLPLLILVADCAPLLLVDAKRRVLAVVHAGWRGAVAGIASRTVARMVEEFGARAQEIQAGIGPCLCVECLEVGEEVAEQARPFHAVRSGREKPHLDLRQIIRHDLDDAGVLFAHIEAMAACPRCHKDLFFSHRGQNGAAGRFGLVAWWEAS